MEKRDTSRSIASGSQAAGKSHAATTSRGTSKLAVFVAAILCLCLVAMTAFQGVQKAQAVNLSAGSCSIEVKLANPNGDEPSSTPNNMSYKLYKVAEATQLGNDDAYTLSAIAPFASLDDTIADLTSDTSKSSQSDYEELAQQAAAIVYEQYAQIDKVITFAEDPDTKVAKDEGINPGLYLLVAYGANSTSVVGANDSGLKEIIKGAGEGATTQYVSCAYSDTEEFTFSPQLISLPTKEAAAGSVANTADSGEWQNDVTVTLKWEPSPLTGSLTINKSIIGWPQENVNVGVSTDAAEVGNQLVQNNASANSTFVFRVVGTLGGQQVYNNVVTLDYTQGRSVTINDLPIGAQFTVTEEYTGATFEAFGNSAQTTTITKEGASVTFSNRYIDKANNGGSITNSFDYDDEGGWVWSQGGLPSTSEGGDNS